LTLTLKLVRGGAKRFWNILIRAQALQVQWVKNGEHVQAYVQRRFWIIHQVAYNHVILAKIAVFGD
jgi:hypothetical protein